MERAKPTSAFEFKGATLRVRRIVRAVAEVVDWSLFGRPLRRRWGGASTTACRRITSKGVQSQAGTQWGATMDQTKPSKQQAWYLRASVWLGTAIAGGLVGSWISGAITHHYQVQEARFDSLTRVAAARFQATPEWKQAGCSDAEFFLALNEAVVMFNYSPAVREALKRFRTESETSDRVVFADALEAMMRELGLDVLERESLITPLTPVTVTTC
jgi:hypothetical protein